MTWPKPPEYLTRHEALDPSQSMSSEFRVEAPVEMRTRGVPLREDLRRQFLTNFAASITLVHRLAWAAAQLVLQ
jgi:hypothetical protein